jgi:hypothetical protein
MSFVSATGINGSIQVHSDHVLIIKPGAGLVRIEIGNAKRVEYEPPDDDEKKGWIKVVTDETHLPITTLKNAHIDGKAIVFSRESEVDFSRVQTALYYAMTKRPKA